jgi:hypothetical protein
MSFARFWQGIERALRLTATCSPKSASSARAIGANFVILVLFTSRVDGGVLEGIDSFAVATGSETSALTAAAPVSMATSRSSRHWSGFQRVKKPSRGSPDIARRLRGPEKILCYLREALALIFRQNQMGCGLMRTAAAGSSRSLPAFHVAQSQHSPEARRRFGNRRRAEEG